MELRQYLNLIRKWLWLIILCTVLAGVTAYFISRQQTPVYRATATILINQARAANRTNDYADILSSERVARTYAELLQDWPVIEQTAGKLGLEEDFRDIARRYHIAISVTPVRDTQLVELSAESSDPELSARIANTLPEVFKQINQQNEETRYASVRQELQSELDAVSTEIAATQETINQLPEDLSEEQRSQLVQLQTELELQKDSYDFLRRSLAELRLLEAQAADNIVLATPAKVPADPVRPRVLFNTLLAALVGAMLALGAAFLIEYLDDTIKTPEDIRAYADLPTLGAVFMLDGDDAASRLVAETAPRSPAAEAYRVLRTNLQFSSLDRALQTIIVTSPGPGEGKSVTCANLALVMAQAGNRVLLLDADLRRPTTHRLFQLPNNAGVTTVLLDIERNFPAAVQNTGTPNLQVLTTGPIPPNPAELLGSERMKELIGFLRSRYDVVVFDSPPVLAVTDAAILSKKVDGLLLVVGAGETKLDVFARALERLDSVSIHPLGVVLNKLTARSSGSYYYYYYHYSTQYHSTDDASRDGKTKSQKRGNGRLRRSRTPRTSEQAS